MIVRSGSNLKLLVDTASGCPIRMDHVGSALAKADTGTT